MVLGAALLAATVWVFVNGLVSMFYDFRCKTHEIGPSIRAYIFAPWYMAWHRRQRGM